MSILSGELCGREEARAGAGRAGKIIPTDGNPPGAVLMEGSEGGIDCGSGLMIA